MVPIGIDSSATRSVLKLCKEMHVVNEKGTVSQKRPVIRIFEGYRPIM